ncbi:MAG TPA: V-type ATP synthase subunit F [bacterium]|nr:V-type ATP synthase subunit F [bacterium]HOL67003.1 V-type ATP synthase subunit F [bacterium]HPP12810.1 V-type ATP synthase subunit F [bacterium]
MTFFCIADPESGLGFMLAGVQTRMVLTRPQALEALREALSHHEVGIILVTSEILNLVQQEAETLLYQQEFPLILEIPSRGKRMRRRPVNEFLKEILGVSV